MTTVGRNDFKEICFHVYIGFVYQSFHHALWMQRSNPAKV